MVPLSKRTVPDRSPSEFAASAGRELADGSRTVGSDGLGSGHRPVVGVMGLTAGPITRQVGALASRALTVFVLADSQCLLGVSDLAH